MKKWAYSKHDNLEEDDSLHVPKLFRDRHLNDDFTTRVMDQIQRTELHPASVIKTAGLSGIHRNRRMKHVFQWGTTALAVGTFAALIFLLNPLAPQSSMSSPPKSLLILPDEWAALDLTDAKSLGIIQEPNLAISDQGYTLTLQEVVTDPTRMVLNVRITDATGKSVPEALYMFDPRQLQITNEDGIEIGRMRSIKTWGSETEKFNPEYNPEYMLLTYDFPNEQPGDTVFIQGNVHTLVTDYDNNKNLSGDWSFNYQTDMKKAHKLSVTTELNETYTTPDGLKLEMERLVHTPAGASLEFVTSLTDQAATRTPEELKNELGVMFHFEDENGEVLTNVNRPLDGGYIDKTISYTQKLETSGKTHWTYNFTNLPYDSEQVRFILDGYYIPIQSNDLFTFSPKDLTKESAVFKAQGDLLNLNSIKITETTSQPGLSAWIAISGRFTNKFDKDEWIARDVSGKEYNVIHFGSYNDGENVTFGETDDHANKIHLIIKDLQTIPEKLTLIRTITDKKYTNVNWSFDLPRIERNKALK